MCCPTRWTIAAQAPHAEITSARQQWGYFRAPNGYWDIDGEPYTVAPDNQFNWFRSRILGGRTNHYGRISLRFSDYDFKPDATAWATDWPITYDEISPYYDKAEDFIGVTGTKEGLRTAPDGNFLPPIPPRVHEVLIQKACDKLNIPCIPSRMAMLTKPFNGRAACHYCGQCGRGCQTASAFSSSQAMIFPAMKTGKLTVIHRRHGARTDHRRIGQGHRGLLCRQGHPHGEADPVPRRGGGGERLRIGAPAAEFEIAALFERHRQLLRAWSAAISPTRSGYSLSGHSRRSTACRGTTATASAACTCTCRGGCTTIRRRISRAAIISKSAADSACRSSARSAGQCARHEGYGKALKQKIREDYGATSASPAAAK